MAGWRTANRVAVVAAVALLAPLAGMRAASAHPYAASAFDAVTEAQDVFVQFRLDATATLEALKHEGRALGKEQLDGAGADIVGYTSAHFLLRNGGDDCPGIAQRPVHFDPRSDKVFVELLYRCARPLGVVTLRTGMFEEDPTTTHQLLGTFRHQRAQENYLLSRGTPEAIIDTAHLAQVGPAEATRPGRVRLVTPPPGAFDNEPRVMPPPTTTSQVPAAAPIGSGFLAFLWQGIQHILGGLDHVLFVIALVSVVTSWRELAKVITSFTLAHSLTLALGALELVRLSPRLVEPVIAASIIYVAVENVARLQPRARLGVTFGFGLMHGFGFSSVLRELGLGRGNLAAALLGFNLGVELGQLVIVAPLAPLVWWLQRRTRVYAPVRLGVNAAVALVAGWWFVQRVRGG